MDTETVVVGTDFSEHGNAAAAYAVHLAARLDARVRVVHAWLLPPTAIAIGALPGTGPVYDQLEQKHEVEMARLVEALASAHDVAIEGEVVHGLPHEVLIGAAERWKAMLIVVGTRGRASTHDPLLGSVAETIVRRAPCPVLVARPTAWTR